MLTPQQHKDRHVMLARALEELVDDYIRHTGCSPRRRLVQDLKDWAQEQKARPSEFLASEDDHPKV